MALINAQRKVLHIKNTSMHTQAKIAMASHTVPKNRHYDNIIFLDYKPIDIFLQAMLTGAIDLSNRTHTFDNLYTLYSKSVIATACAQDNFQNNQVSSSFLDYCARKSSTQEKHIEIQYETICHIVD